MVAPAPSLPALAHRFGTPLYVYDAEALRGRAVSLRNACAAPIHLLYCVKANPAGPLLEALHGAVDGLDVSSGGEVRLALGAGYPAATLSFAGPGKADEELALAVREGVTLSVESEGELARLLGIATPTCPANVVLRINPRVTAAAFAMKMGGGPSAFGVPEEDAAPLLRRMRSEAALRVEGLHVYAGTQCLDAATLLAGVDETLRLAGELSGGAPLGTVNLGGGLGVAYFAGQAALDLAAFGAGLAERLDRARREPWFRDTRFVLEVGRWLAAPAGTYVSRVVDVKTSRGKRYIVLDGGMNHFFAGTGGFGQVLRKNHPVFAVGGAAGPLEPYDVVGPLCTPLDTLGRGVLLPPVEVGQLLAFPLAGAYGYTASPLLFLGHRTPTEVVVDGDTVRVARRPLSITELSPPHG